MSDYTVYDYILDIIRGEVPGPADLADAPDDNGPLGEYLIEFVLGNTPATKGRPTYANLIVPNADSPAQTAEIDVLLLMPEGILVFESKNYSGWIFGSADQRQWTMSLPHDRKERFYNPVMQNRTHVRALAACLGLPESAFRSYIVFSRRCTLQHVPDDTDEYRICQRPELRGLLERDLGGREAVFDDDALQEIRGKLDALAAASDADARELHVEQAQAAIHACPFCGKPLVERRRADDGGAFIGCSGYPDCRYTRSSW